MRRLLVSTAALAAVCLSWAALACGLALAASAPELQVSGASLIVSGTDQQLYGYHPGGERAIASTTKLMTALIVLQRVHNLSTVFKQNDWVPAADDSQIGLVPGERMTVRNLLKAMLIPSADDAAEDLAYNVGHGSIPRFLKMMNREAHKLGLTHTHYTTPTGLDTAGNYSSPSDLVRLAAYDMHHSAFFRQTVRTQNATISSVSGSSVYYLVNTDTLLGAVPWIEGIKTGHTNDAGYVLVSQGTRDGFTLIASVLGTSSEDARNDNALALLKWGYAHFHLVHPVTKGHVYARPTVTYRTNPARLIAAYGYKRVVARSAKVRLHVKAPKEISGPMKRGAVVGTVTVTVAGRRVDRVPLVLAKALPAVATITKVAHFIGGPFTLIGILLLVVGGVVLVRQRRKRPTQGRRSKVRMTGGLEEQ